MNSNRRENILKLVQLAILTVLVIVLQSFGSAIKIGPLPMSFVLVPIVIGACLLGAKAGAFLGFVFGLITMLMGVLGVDGFSFILFEANPVWFVILCILKATLAGFASGLVYSLLGKLFEGKNKLLQTVLASITAPIVNTGIFVIGMLLFFIPTMDSLRGDYANAVQFIFLGLAGWNFVGEFVVNLVLSPAIVRIIDVVKKKLHF